MAKRRSFVNTEEQSDGFSIVIHGGAFRRREFPSSLKRGNALLARESGGNHAIFVPA
jgi:hypothetical protein